MPSVNYQRTLGYNSPGDPGSEQERKWKARNLVKATAVKPVKTLWVHRTVYVQMNALCVYLQANGAKLGENVDDWGFANRDIRGYPGTKSYHSWALAIDLDATENPLGRRKTSFARTAVDIEEVRQVCNWLGLRWGLDYSGRPDAMHFESIVSRVRAFFIKKQLMKPTWRSRRLAKLCDMDVHNFVNRISRMEPY